MEAARLWGGSGFYGTDGRFHIHGVTAATIRRLCDEYPADYATLVHQTGLRPGEAESWERTAAEMYVPFDEQRSIHPRMTRS